MEDYLDFDLGFDLDNGGGTKTLYGIDFPADMPDELIHLKCWKHWREEPYIHGNIVDPWDCFWRGIYGLVPKEDFVRHTWAEQHVYDWTTEDFLIVWGAAASGKALRLDAIVYTPDGPRTMGELEVGDTVLAQDGRTAEVIQTHDVGEQEEYRVSFTDGTSTICCGSHLWEVGGRNSTRVRNRVKTTEWLAKQPRRTQYIPLCEPVYMRHSPVSIDPYVLGALLGDGCLGGRKKDQSITFTSCDADILAAFSSRLDPEYELRHTARYGYALVSKESIRGTKRNAYKKRLEHYGLLGKTSEDKFVPKEYLYNSKRTRMEILRGLLDTDGTCSKTGALTYTSVSKQLAKDVQYLVQSLGGIASISEKQPHYKGRDGERVACKTSYSVCFRLNSEEPLFYCARKQERVHPFLSGLKGRMIEKVERLGTFAPMKCITIDHPRGLYMTNDFIVTHNSNDFGMLCLVDWLVDPSETVAVLASTTLSMLKLRSFESVTRYFHKMKRHAKFPIPGKLSKTTTAVLLDDKDDGVDATDKASVRGVAVSEGTEDEARAKLQGAHLPYVRLILDELSQMRSAAMAVRTNLAIGAKNFKLIGLCNPDGFNDLAGRYSVPDVPGGYSTLDPNKDFEWRSTYGKVRRHDGLQSPAIIEPDGDRKYPFLLTQKVLDELLRQVGGNWDDPQLQTMIRAWPPAEGKRQTLLSVAEAVSNRAQETVTWMDRPMVTVIGVDPAFTEGGNKGVMQALDVGLDVNNQIRLFFREPRYIRVAASSKEPILAQVGNQIIDYAEELHVPPGLIGVDDSATQSVVDYLQHQRMWKVNRFIASRKPLEAPITQGDRMSAKDRFYNQSVELWAATAAFIRAGQVRGFPDIALEQLTTRPTEEGRTPIRLVSKRTKARDGGYATGDSPDEMDAVSYAVGVLRYHLHFIAGMSNITAKIGSGGTARFGNQDLTRLAQRFDLDAKAYQRN